MNDFSRFAETLHGLAHELNPDQTAEITPARRTRGRQPERDTLRIVQRDGVLLVDEPAPQIITRRRGPTTDTDLHYEHQFDRLDRSQIVALLERLDQRLTPHRGLRQLTDTSLHALQRFPESGRVLLLIHGTFSNSESFFSNFADNPAGDAFLDWARGHYSHIITFDHPTLTVSPILNARALALLIGNSRAQIDVVCHSRGGLVTRWWLEAFDHAAPDQRRALFVGSPLAGTGLAAPGNLRASLSLLSNIGFALGAASAAVPFLAVLTGLFQVFTTVTRLAASTPAVDAAVALVPGLAAQSRAGNNPELRSLRQADNPLAGRYHAVRANFETDKPGWAFWRYFRNLGGHAADMATNRVFDGHNDLVVDTGSMTDLGGNLYIPDERVWDFGTTGEVHHTNYFAQPQTLAFIRQQFEQPTA